MIWANHLMRSAVDAMQATARKIFEDECLVEVEDRIASVNEVFRLQGADELAAAEHRYGMSHRRDRSAIVLAASRGEQLRELTYDRPKAMLSVNGRPMLERLVESLRRHAIGNVTVVAGYKPQTIDIAGIELLVNDRHATGGELTSLVCARHAFHDDMVIVYADVLFRSYVLRGLLESDRDVTVVVDSQSHRADPTSVRDHAYCSARDDRSLWGQDVLLERVDATSRVNGTHADGRWIGVLRARSRGRAWIEQALDVLSLREDFERLTLGDLLNEIVRAGHAVRVMYIHGHWLDVNSIADLERAGEFIAGQR